MAIVPDDPIEQLGDDDCWRLLRSSSLGRLAVSVLGEPDIFPINFVAADGRIVFRTAQGTKLAALTANERVALETDGVVSDAAWSVVVKGTARVLDRQHEIDAANDLPLRPLIPTLKYVFVEITPSKTTGIRFRPGPEPERF